MRRPNPSQPAQTTSAERLTELSEILALGLVRLRARQSSRTISDTGENSLEPVARRSGHANPEAEKA